MNDDKNLKPEQPVDGQPGVEKTASKIVKTFLIAGPPLGLLGAFFAFASYGCMLNAVDWFHGAKLFPELKRSCPEPGEYNPLALFIGAPFSYFFGGVQALFIGIVSAHWYRQRGRLPLFLPLMLALICSVGSTLFFLNGFYFRVRQMGGHVSDSDYDYLLGSSYFYGCAHLFAAILGWLIVRKMVISD